MKTIETAPPAKINLVLRVLNRRRGPLHHLQSLMQTVSWQDELTLTKRIRPGIQFSCEGLRGADSQANLAYRAAVSVIREAGLREGVTIRLKKRIPDGAGLGGGSSDAASVFLGMKALWQLPWSSSRFTHLALALGSDVPFFLWGGVCEVSGVGERVKPRSGAGAGPVLLVTFPIRLSTAEAYRVLDRSRSSGRAKKIEKGKFHNDFSPIIRSRYQKVHEVWQALEDEVSGGVGMTGKGPTLFIQTKPGRAAAHLAGVVRRIYAGCQTRTVVPVISPISLRKSPLP